MQDARLDARGVIGGVQWKAAITLSRNGRLVSSFITPIAWPGDGAHG